MVDRKLRALQPCRGGTTAEPSTDRRYEVVSKDVWCYSERHAVDQWAQIHNIIRAEFMRYVTDGGAPDDAVMELIGLRLNDDAARDGHGEMQFHFECEPDDPRVFAVELRMTWLA
jgi:hypothetical protein